MNYDYIIIGAGIAGLYAAYNIKKIYPNKTFIILEANSKKYIGGRVHQEMFENHLVTTGAGVGRKNKDTYLINLLDELKISYSESNKNFNYTFNPLDLKKIIKNLKVKFIELNKPRKTFKEFVLPILGSTIYKKLVLTSGYSDYENDDAEHVFYMYGLDDLNSGWTALIIPWMELIYKLIDKINIINIKVNSKVIKIDNTYSLENITIYTENNKIYKCNKLIVATTIDSLRKLFKTDIYKEIKAQPFIRIYATVKKKYIEIMKEKVEGKQLVTQNLIFLYTL